jgi:hypothetical protein
MKIGAGKWEIDLSPPWPIWVQLKYKGEDVGPRFSAIELGDLQYTIQRARAVARTKDNSPLI